MSLAEQTQKAHVNHQQAVQDFKESMKSTSPAHVEEALAYEAIMQDTLTSFLTYNTWVRSSGDVDFDSIEINE